MGSFYKSPDKYIIGQQCASSKAKDAYLNNTYFK